MGVIALRGVSLRRRERTVLQDVDLDVRPGELLVVVGPNGAGKSSLLAVLAGDLPPTTGTALLEGRPLSSYKALELARLRSVLLQQSPVAFGFTAREVVRMGRAPWDDGDDAAVDHALRAAGAEELADRPVTALSGGEQARVQLARVLAQDTPLVMLDEPTAALDVRHAEQALGHARSLVAQGCTVVLVAHDLNLAAAHADRIALVGDGRLVAVGPPAEVLTVELLSAAYGHPFEVMAHPRTAAPLVFVRR